MKEGRDRCIRMVVLKRDCSTAQTCFIGVCVCVCASRQHVCVLGVCLCVCVGVCAHVAGCWSLSIRGHTVLFTVRFLRYCTKNAFLPNWLLQSMFYMISFTSWVSIPDSTCVKMKRAPLSGLCFWLMSFQTKEAESLFGRCYVCRILQLTHIALRFCSLKVHRFPGPVITTVHNSIWPFMVVFVWHMEARRPHKLIL